MRRLVLTLGVLSISCVGAAAADLPMKAPPMVMPPPLVYNWTGCYIGVHAGGAWSRSEATNTADTTAFGDLAPGDGFSQDDSGFIGGGQIGCNYQFASNWVVGLEGSFAGTTIKGDFANTVFGAADDVFTTEINSVALVTGRLGYAWNNWLLYAKGGYAGADVKFSVSDTVGANQGAGSDTQWRSGWTVGGGLEYGITPNWIVGVEYDYMNLGTHSYEVGGGAGLYTFDVKTQIHQAVARLSYKF
jgi:outer membrane immunogenic protein